MFIKYKTNYRQYIFGVETDIPLKGGGRTKAINFDNAATTPPLIPVLQGLINFAPWYSSIHRGVGYKSQYSSEMYDNSRQIVAEFVKADPKQNTVIYVKNATEAINKLSNRLCFGDKNAVVLSTDMEHHSNDLPWRGKYHVDYINIKADGRLSLEDLESKLQKYKGRVKLVTVTGASNVTGFINPIHTIAAIVHRHGTRLLVDGSQLVPHAPVEMLPQSAEAHIDFLVFSAHKMYAPFGIGVLIGPTADFLKGEPDYKGGGTIDIVTHDFVRWADPPDKDEAGTPNIMGVVALTEAIKTLTKFSMKNIEAYERSLMDYALNKMKLIPDITLYTSPDTTDNRVSIIPLNIDGLPHSVTAAILSYEWGIAVRSGCFCAQPYVQKLLKVTPEEIQEYIDNPSSRREGMVRVSFGIYNQYWEIDVLIKALSHIAANKDEYLEEYRFVMEEDE